MVVSSKKSQISVYSMKKIRSSMKRLDKIGPNIDPCGTPLRV